MRFNGEQPTADQWLAVLYMMGDEGQKVPFMNVADDFPDIAEDWKVTEAMLRRLFATKHDFVINYLVNKELVHCWWKPVTYLSFGVPTAADEVLDTKQKEMAIAMMIFEKSSNEEFCKPCSNNNHRGPGTECIVPDSSDYRKPSEGSCANCYGRMAAQKCSLRKALEEAGDGKVKKRKRGAR